MILQELTSTHEKLSTKQERSVKKEKDNSRELRILEMILGKSSQITGGGTGQTHKTSLGEKGKMVQVSLISKRDPKE